MQDEISEKLESMLDRKLSSQSRHKHLMDGFKKHKVINEVLDKSTIMTLYKMLKDEIITYVDGSVSAGKESVLFYGVDKSGVNVALKIYLTSTSNFKKRELYILGDPRFSRYKKGTRNIVYLWAKKEFRNLTQCHNAGIRVPKPIHVANNVLALEFIGQGNSPSKTLLNSKVDKSDYTVSISIINDLYNKAKLVHGDYSEYNIFKTPEGLIVFDLGSAVDLKHPNALELLKRDINNITRFFNKRGIIVNDPINVFEDIVK